MSPTPPFVSNDDLLRFVDGRVDDEDRVRVLTHLAGRPAAVERVEAYLHQNARMRNLRDHLPCADSRDFAAPLQAALVASLRRRQARRRWQHPAAAAALALTLVSSAIGLAPELWHAPSAAPGMAADTAPQAFFLFDEPEHAALVATTVATTDPELDDTAFAWLAAQLSDFSITAPDFAHIGLQPIGGDILERQGAPAIRLVYQDRAGKPVVFHVGIGKPDADHAFWLVREGYVSLHWRRGPMVFAIVAPTGSPQLSQVVDIVSAAVARLPTPEAEAAPETPAKPVSAPAESGPLQTIAVPAAPAPSTAAEPAETSNQPAAEIVPKTKPENAPEPL